MIIEILCTPKFNKREIAGLDAYGKAHGMTREEVVRLAVANFSKACVPTHGKPSGTKA